MSLTIIYIRHAEKAYANGKGPADLPHHDPDILPEEEPKCQELGAHLIATYGPPDTVLSSPYLRARRTAALLVSAIPEAIRPNIVLDAQIAEFLGHQKRYKEPDVYPETSCVGQLPPPRESFRALSDRGAAHLHAIGLASTSNSPYTGARNVWVVTHGLFIQTLVKLLKLQWMSGLM